MAITEIKIFQNTCTNSKIVFMGNKRKELETNESS